MASAPGPFGSFDPEIVQLFEGFSIPAQREANARKAESLGARVVAEFVVVNQILVAERNAGDALHPGTHDDGAQHQPGLVAAMQTPIESTTAFGAAAVLAAWSGESSGRP